MSQGYRPDIPNWAMNQGERIADWPLINGLDRWMNNSSSPYYRKTRFNRVLSVIDKNEKPSHMQEVEADLDSNLLSAVFRRLLSKIVVLGADKSEIDDIKKYFKGNLGLAFTYKGVTRAGVISYEPAYLESLDMYAAGLREGPNRTEAGLVVIQAEQKRVIVPELSTAEPHLPIDAVPANEYPQLLFS